MAIRVGTSVVAIEGPPPAVDRTLRTSSRHVYAPGDVNGRSMLLHSVVRQSIAVAHVILAGGQPVDAMSFETVPKTVSSEAEAAHVGLTEAQACERVRETEVTRYDYTEDARAEILGADAAQLIAPLAPAVQAGDTATTLAEMAFPHPMISECFGKAARSMHA